MTNRNRDRSADHHDLTRREVLGALAAGLPAGAALAGREASPVQGRRVIAALVTVYRKAPMDRESSTASLMATAGKAGIINRRWTSSRSTWTRNRGEI